MSASSTLKAIEARKHSLTVEWLPKYAPELNDIEVVWHDLKARHLAHQTFADADALDRAIHAAVGALNRERTINPLVIQKISLARGTVRRRRGPNGSPDGGAPALPRRDLPGPPVIMPGGLPPLPLSAERPPVRLRSRGTSTVRRPAAPADAVCAHSGVHSIAARSRAPSMIRTICAPFSVTR